MLPQQLKILYFFKSNTSTNVYTDSRELILTMAYMFLFEAEVTYKEYRQ